MEIKAIRKDNVVELNVREMQKQKEEPFHVIMDAVDSLKQGDTLILHTIINPVPLLGVMEGRGFGNEVEQLEEDHWKISFKMRDE